MLAPQLPVLFQRQQVFFLQCQQFFTVNLIQGLSLANPLPGFFNVQFFYAPGRSAADYAGKLLVGSELPGKEGAVADAAWTPGSRFDKIGRASFRERGGQYV